MEQQPKQKGGRRKKVNNTEQQVQSDQPTEQPTETQQVETEQPAALTEGGASEPKATKPKVARVARGPKKPTINQQDAVLNQYLGAGWIAMRQTNGGLNDIIAHKDKKLHFVQVVTKPDDARYNGLALNTFIQNAFSNNAIPVHAKCVIDEKDDGSVLSKITFANVNDNSRVIVSAAKAKK